MRGCRVKGLRVMDTTTAKRSARLEKKREDTLASEVLQLQKRIETLEATVGRLQHDAGDYRKNRNELLTYFTTSRGGPECMMCCSKKAAPVTWQRAFLVP